MYGLHTTGKSTLAAGGLVRGTSADVTRRKLADAAGVVPRSSRRGQAFRPRVCDAEGGGIWRTRCAVGCSKKEPACFSTAGRRIVSAVARVRTGCPRPTGGPARASTWVGRVLLGLVGWGCHLVWRSGSASMLFT